jgi:lysophospholipase L1-like esterase
MLTFLALGDSYTIGEQVLLAENFPYQAEQKLRKKGYHLAAPEIIAKTGWTTDELTAAIDQTVFQDRYDMVTLLIGVNNQYRGRSAEEYKNEFESLLLKAIRFADKKNKNVFVLSIPDWGITPFAQGRDEKQIAMEIDAFNAIAKKITEEHRCHFIDITASQRAEGRNAEMLAPDGLHPSGKEYEKWAEQLADAFISAHSS